MKHRIDRSGHGPKRSHRNIPYIPDLNRPHQVRIGDQGGHRRLEPIEELFDRRSHLPQNGLVEAGRVGAAADFGGNDLGDGDKAHVAGFRVGSDEPEPLLGYDEGNDRVGGYGMDGVAEAHHGVDVAATGDRQCSHVARGGWSGISEVHVVELAGRGRRIV